ncbi:MAG: hypothetical protein ABSH29_17325 [Acidimicrobiales bacterium]|jgi:hypothetical protein
MTNDLAERIQTKLVGSLDDPTSVLSIHVREGWGDVFYVTIRVRGSHLYDRNELEGRLESAVASAMGEARHLVRIEWG